MVGSVLTLIYYQATKLFTLHLAMYSTKLCFFLVTTCKIRSQILFFKSFFSTHSLLVKNVARLALDLFLKFVYPFLLFGANLVSNWFRLHQKVLALIYYIRKLFTPLKNPAFTARVHFSPISTEIQIRQSREKYIPSAASIENFC